MQIELRREFISNPSNLPDEFKPYRILYWFASSRIPVEGQVIYLPDPTMAKRIEGAIDASK